MDEESEVKKKQLLDLEWKIELAQSATENTLDPQQKFR
jgi:hypothetical protein